jgi:hypothetical protein
MYVPEFQGLLERHFGHVRLYRQGAVAGGLVFPVSGELTAAAGVPVESVRLSSSGPSLGGGPPTTRSVMAVCSESGEVPGQEEEEGAYLLLDRDRRVFDECEERAEDVDLMLGEIQRMQETEIQAFLKAISAQQLPLGVLLRLIPQVVLYYFYDSGQIDYEEANGRQATAIEETRRRWETTLAKSRHRWDVTLAKSRHGRDVVLAKSRHGRDVAIVEARRHRDAAIEEAHHRRDVAIVEARLRRDAAIEEAHRRRDAAIEEARHRRDVAIVEARLRRDATFEEARRRRDVVLVEARHRRDVAVENTRHRRNLVFAEIRHRRNVTLERIIHRQNIIRGNMQALRQKDARGLIKGTLRRLTALYRRLREQQKP